MNTSPFLASPGMVILFKWTWLLALGWLAHWAFHHRHARWRLILWRSILCFGLALPVLNFIQFPLIRIPIASAGVGTSQSNTPVSPIVPADAIEPVLSKRQPQTPVAAISPPQDAVSVQSLAAPKPFRWESFLLVVWASGCVFGACRLFRLHLQLSRLRKETCRPSPDLQGLARQIQLRLNVRQKVDVHISDAITSPFVCGLLKPAIILPRLLAQQLSPSEVSALLSHEIAHLRRHDLVWCVAWRWMNAVCWFHPLVWKIAEAHNLACEEEADLVASGLCGEQDSYAQFLARLALRVLALPVVESELTLNASSQIARRLCYLGQKGIEAWNWRHSVAGFGMVGVLFLATAGCEFSKAGPVGPKGGAAKFYEITGTVNITPHPWRTLQNTHGAPEPTWHFGFKCISGTSLWRIENTASVNGIERMFCDGTNMYEYLRQTGPAPDMFNGNPPLGTPRFEPYSPTNDSVSINIFPGTTPSQDVGIGIPWLAFCSGPYLRLPNHVIPLPLRTGMHDTLAYADRTQCFNDDLGLPKTVDLLTSAERYRKSLMDRPPWDHWRLRAQTNFHATIPDGEVKFHYEVTSTTNIGSHEFPVEFKFAGFGSDASNHW